MEGGQTRRRRQVDPDNVQMFEITHTRKKKPMDPPAQEALMPEGIQPNEARKRAFSQVFGVDGHGRERGVGCGGKPFGGRAAKATAALKEQVEKYKQLYEEEKARREEADCENVAARAEKIEFRENMERFNKCMESVKRHLGGSEVLAAFSQFRFSIQHVQLDFDETQPPDATRPLA